MISITQHRPYYFLGYRTTLVVRHPTHGQLVAIMLAADNLDRVHYRLRLQPARDQRPFIHAFRALMSVADLDRQKIKQGGFIGDSTAV